MTVIIIKLLESEFIFSPLMNEARSLISNIAVFSIATLKQLLALFECMRPKQWSKNVLIFAGLIFSQSLLNFSQMLKSFEAFLIFCLLSSSVYILNDVVDLEKDKNHPLKRKRPLPSGRLSLYWAWSGIPLFLCSAIYLAFTLDMQFGYVALTYFILITMYSFFLKSMVIIDVFVIAIGFVLRAAAGTVVIDVETSNWLLICTLFVALFLALSKRRHEIVILGDDRGKHRKNLSEYSTQLLDQMLSVVTASTIISYALYTMSSDSLANFGTRNLMLTIPFVLFGIFRYLYLVYEKNMGGSPEMVLLNDRAMIVNILLYGFTVIAILYF